MEFHCPKCGAKTPVVGDFCMECGHELRQPTEAPPIDYSAPQSYTPKFLADMRQKDYTQILASDHVGRTHNI